MLEDNSVPVVADVDVLVVGGGTAGAVAAIAAARLGSKTLLIEQEDVIGGTLSGQLLQHISEFHDKYGKQIIGGIARELVERLIELGASPGDVPDDTGYSCTYTPINHEMWIYVLEEKLQSAGVMVLTSTLFCKAIMKKNEKVCGAIIENHSGRQAIRAAVTIDCSGDAAAAFSAGAECADPGRGAQALSMLFVLANVNYRQILDYYAAHQSDFRDGSASPELLEMRRILTFWGFGDLLRQGLQKGALSFERKEMHLSIDCQTGQAIVNVTRIAADAMNQWDKTQASFVLRRQVMEFCAFCKVEIPGFQDSYLIKTGKASLIQRESRRIAGQYTLTEDDITSGAVFPDAIAQSWFPSDRHDAGGSSMKIVMVERAADIPYRCLLPQKIKGLLVAGRCISASPVALGSVRITATCMAMGEAAGTAAALSAQARCEPRELRIDTLRDTLCKRGAILK
ncbi:MAG: FAD-dependent oxidoreductase [Treponema sp.]|nr:FAD-dependent oxidoreductase [Treponema sp.]